MFTNEDYHYAWGNDGGAYRLPSTVSSMRGAAKRFVKSETFDPQANWYEGHMENRRWVFIPVYPTTDQ